MGINPSFFKTIKVDANGAIVGSPKPIAKAKPERVLVGTASVSGRNGTSTAPPSCQVLYAPGTRTGWKQWCAWCVGNRLIAEWGAVGATLQRSTKDFRSETMAANAMRDLYRAKRGKGYQGSMK